MTYVYIVSVCILLVNSGDHKTNETEVKDVPFPKALLIFTKYPFFYGPNGHHATRNLFCECSVHCAQIQ